MNQELSFHIIDNYIRGAHIILVMKNLLSLIALLIYTCGIYAQAPSYTDFEFDLPRMGLIVPEEGAYDGGISLGAELRYNVQDNFSVGLRSEISFLGSEELDSDADEYDLGAFKTAMATADYYFSTTSSRRFFVGIGLGNFQTGVLEVRDGQGTINESGGTSSFGIMPRAGYEFGHLRIEIQYNIPSGDEDLQRFGISLSPTWFGGYNE